MNFLMKLLPKPVYESLKYSKRLISPKQDYTEQDLTVITCGDYKIEAPNQHLLVDILKVQPYRDLCVGITAKYISAKYPIGTIVDIGANIGDTAALIATYSKNKLILVEGSDYFFDILARNALLLPNETVLKKVLVSDGSEILGSFNYRAGTASFDEQLKGKEKVQTERLSDIADPSTCLIKTDTDGYDYKILNSSLEWLSSVHPAIIFENQIRNEFDRINADQLCDNLMQIGYAFFVLWDDRGFHLVSTDSLESLKSLNYYLFKTYQRKEYRSLNYYDVLCLHENDKDIYQKICEWYKTY